MLQDRDAMLHQVRMHLQRAQERMKRQADKGRTERVFQVGDWVFLKLQSYCQSSVTERLNHKLAFRFFGPYEIVQQINPVASKLNLPQGTTVHPVFHVSQLTKMVGPRVPVSTSIPDLSQKFQVQDQVLDTRLIRRGGKVVAHVLVQWSSWPKELATWEDEAVIKQQFPFATTWGQAVAQGGRNVNVPMERVMPEDLSDKVSEPAEEDDVPVASRRSQRVPKLNRKYISNMWV